MVRSGVDRHGTATGQTCGLVAARGQNAEIQGVIMAGKNLQDILKAMAREEIKPEAKGLHNDYVSLEQLQKHMKNKYKDVEVHVNDGCGAAGKFGGVCL